MPNVVPQTEMTTHSSSVGRGPSTNIRSNTAISNRRTASVSRAGTGSAQSLVESSTHNNRPPTSGRQFHTRAMSDQTSTTMAGAGSTNRITVTNMNSGFRASLNGALGRASTSRLENGLMSSSKSSNPRGPLSSIPDSRNNISSKGGRTESAGFSRISADGASGGAADKAIVCSCGNDAIILTVRKEGPNTGNFCDFQMKLIGYKYFILIMFLPFLYGSIFIICHFQGYLCLFI